MNLTPLSTPNASSPTPDVDRTAVSENELTSDRDDDLSQIDESDSIASSHSENISEFLDGEDDSLGPESPLLAEAQAALREQLVRARERLQAELKNLELECQVRGHLGPLSPITNAVTNSLP